MKDIALINKRTTTFLYSPVSEFKLVRRAYICIYQLSSENKEKLTMVKVGYIKTPYNSKMIVSKMIVNKLNYLIHALPRSREEDFN